MVGRILASFFEVFDIVDGCEILRQLIGGKYILLIYYL